MGLLPSEFPISLTEEESAGNTAKLSGPSPCERWLQGNSVRRPAVTSRAGRLMSRTLPPPRLPGPGLAALFPCRPAGWRVGRKAGSGEKSARKKRGCESFKDWMGSVPVASGGGGDPPRSNPVIHSFSEIYIIQGRGCKPKGQKYEFDSTCSIIRTMGLDMFPALA